MKFTYDKEDAEIFSSISFLPFPGVDGLHSVIKMHL